MRLIQKMQKQITASVIPNLISKILSNREISESIKSLNPKEREVFNMVYMWAKDNIKYDGNIVESVHIFLLDSGRTGKSYLVKVIQNVISKSFFITVKINQAYRNISTKYKSRTTILFGLIKSKTNLPQMKNIKLL